MSLIISNTLKSQLSKVLWITVGWTFISVFYVLIVYAGLIELELDVSVFDIWLAIKVNLLTGILAGIIGGSMVVFFWEKWLRTKKYGSSLWSILWTYNVIYFITGIPKRSLYWKRQVRTAILSRKGLAVSMVKYRQYSLASQLPFLAFCSGRNLDHPASQWQIWTRSVPGFFIGEVLSS